MFEDLGLDESPKTRAAASRFSVSSDTDEVFTLAFKVLDEYFGPKREMEQLSALVAWRAEPFRSTPMPGVVARYHVALARDEHGEIAGARDALIAYDPAQGDAVALLSHARVLPDYRGSGLAGLLRAIVTPWAHEDAATLGYRPTDVVLVSEMEFLNPNDPDSIRRLAAYNRAGFRALDPRRLRYLQPDFRVRPGAPWVAVPLQFCVRPTQAFWPASRVRRVWSLINAIHGAYVSAAQLTDLQSRSVDRLGDEDVHLLPI